MKLSVDQARHLLKSTIHRIFIDFGQRQFSKTDLLYLVEYDHQLLDTLTSEWVSAGYLKRIKSFSAASPDEPFLEFEKFIDADPFTGRKT